MDPVTTSAAWQTLKLHAQDYFLNSRSSGLPKSNYILQHYPLTLEYTYQNINEKILNLLIDLALECQLPAKIKALLSGQTVNESHSLPALHTALRAKGSESLWIDNRNIIVDVVSARQKMNAISLKIREKNWFGFSGKPIENIVNIGIGGSDLGPQFCINALSDFITEELSFYFISDADPDYFEKIINQLNPETTLFIICSKSFTTKETLYNMRKAMKWINQPNHINNHFIAVTAKVDRAKEFGLENILPIWDWVGGRFSICSAINLITCIAIGFENFTDFLNGACDIDEHFAQAPLKENLPVLMALFGIWNINFLNMHSLLLLVYSRNLELFIPYIQQLDMESNGKSTNNLGDKIDYTTSPIVWGGLGNQAQHSYYQLLCQGSHKIAADFISIQKFDNELINIFRDNKIKVLSEGVESLNSPYDKIPGGMPINHIKLDSCTPYNLGALTALYEHKIFVQSVVWNINAFDQPGVESAKQVRELI